VQETESPVQVESVKPIIQASEHHVKARGRPGESRERVPDTFAESGDTGQSLSRCAATASRPYLHRSLLGQCFHGARKEQKTIEGLGLSSDLDGPYILLAGIGAVFLATATLAFAAQYPFLRAGGTYGQ